MQERREHLRVQISVPVTCQLGQTDSFGGVATELSLWGTRVVSTRVPAVGAVLVIVARLPGSPVLSRLPGVVSWTRRAAFGVRFDPLGARDSRLIAELMAKTVGGD